MGILNVTPDSFFAGSRSQCAGEIASRVEEMVKAGADIIDVGACSTRPGQERVAGADEELERLRMALPVLREVAPEIPVSVDTFRARVAEVCIRELGADIINDISMASDPEMIPTAARLHTPYILMHMRGNPSTMQTLTDYGSGGGDVTAGVISELSAPFESLRSAGVCDVIVDPGLGFAKTPDQCYRLLRDTPVLAGAFAAPVLIGLSRKSMITRPLGITADHALDATVAANTLALMAGASILRVHDVEAAVRAVQVCELYRNS